ncbi:helix-turn-helix domain-containing protein [Bacillus sp. 1P02SD]|uniref:helix-turn-helix domain-containing protein n=1 Tax=Bacillus sp. 1P02SD TaxID=3132264 RepID=UPI0039A14936
MKDKISFSEFIAEKRKLANLTQKEFADLLFVSDSAVSKWERGLSYPDITLISRICEVLNITEHEFVTASDDISAREEKRQAKMYRGFLKGYQGTLNVSYALALVTCFICNVAINHTLSWFFIVLVSIALAFSITTLPIMVKKHKTLITFSVATVLIYILLFVCSTYSSGDWLLTIAYPITTFPIIFAWSTMFIIKYVKVNWILKSGFISLIWAMFCLIINPVIDYFIGDKPGLTISDFINLTDWQPSIIGNKIAFLSLTLLGLVAIIVGMQMQRKSVRN